MKKTISIAMLVAVALAGCSKKDKDKQGGSSAAKGGTAAGGGGAAKTYAALTADAPLENITPADKPPMEALAFRMTGKRDKGGYPEYDGYNLGTKVVTYAYITVYAYDKDGKQVARNEPPLNWNGKLEPGKKSDWAISVGSFKEGEVPESATSFDICYSSIKFEGDAAQTSEDGRCPTEKAKGK